MRALAKRDLVEGCTARWRNCAAPFGGSCGHVGSDCHSMIVHPDVRGGARRLCSPDGLFRFNQPILEPLVISVAIIMSHEIFNGCPHQRSPNRISLSRQDSFMAAHQALRIRVQIIAPHAPWPHSKSRPILITLSAGTSFACNTRRRQTLIITKDEGRWRIAAFRQLCSVASALIAAVCPVSRNRATPARGNRRRVRTVRTPRRSGAGRSRGSGHKIAVVHNPPARTVVYNRTVVYERNVVLYKGGCVKRKASNRSSRMCFRCSGLPACAVFYVHNRGLCTRSEQVGRVSP